MELALNLGWTVLATAMCWLCAHHARREGRGRWAQFVSLALVLVTTFSVIGMYDDMAMAQNPAETRSFQREDDSSAHAHASLHPVAASTPTLAAELPFNAIGFAAPSTILAPTAKVLVLSFIQNRPPPTA